MKAKKNKIVVPEILPGQVSLWDVEFAEKPKDIIKNNELSTENKDLIIEKKVSYNAFEITEQQRKAIKKFKSQKDISRIIIYAKGSIGIEIIEDAGFINHYITREGKEELSFSNKSPVLPWDKIVYYGPDQEKVPFTKLQTDKLQKLLCNQRDNIKRVVHRKGDENILIEFPQKVIDILPNGWELEFKSINHVECEEDEVYLVPLKENKEVEAEDIWKLVKKGDYVQALYGKKTIEGTIVNEYGNNNEILNIIFDNGRKHTAIARRCVLKILKSA